MHKVLLVLGIIVLVISCTPVATSHNFTSVQIETVFKDSVSIRAITFLDETTLAFAGSNGIYGSVDLATHTIRTNRQTHDSILPEFRAVTQTKTDFFMLAAAHPALLYKTGAKGEMELVYREEGEGVFYDAMKFWNNREGIAIGDSTDGCLSVLITRDGGNSWHKIPCSDLPRGIDGEGAFAASNTNIEIMGDSTWVATTESRIYFSPDKGETWQIQSVPMHYKKPTQGIYSLDFYNALLGIAFGGDYTDPENPGKNKALTTDGGASWKLIADGTPPGYKSCVQFIPNSGGKDVVAVGFTGITYSKDSGTSWKTMSDQGFYTILFLNDSTAYAAGKHRISRLLFK
ncbi:MAG: oxidoreductase [Bacteroidota bacterium]